MQTHWKKFQCVDPKDMHISGSYNSDSARLIEVQLVQCHDRDDCKSPEQIKSFLQNKFLLLLHNRVRFDRQEFGEKLLVEESLVSWIPINTQMRMRLPYKISLEDLELQDHKIKLDSLTQETHEALFEMEEMTGRSYEKDDHVLADLTLELNLNLRHIEREGYQSLDLLSDVGGIWAILSGVFSALLTVLNFNNLDTFMASRLFKIKKENADVVKYENYSEQSNYFSPPKFDNLKQYAMRVLPQKLVCCKQSRKERAIAKAIKAMDDEIDIIEMIKSRRYFKGALNQMMPAEKRMKLKERSRYIMIDPDSDDADSAQTKQRKQFNNVLDLYEAELNQDPGNLTDGFYSSSGAEDE